MSPRRRPDFSSARTGGTDTWLTPPWILDGIRQNYTIVLDPCTEESNPTEAIVYCHLPDWNGLELDWAETVRLYDRGVAYVNPPYSLLRREWGEKIASEAENGCPMVCLLPSRTNQKWFQRLARLTMSYHGNVCFLDKRLKFHKPDGTVCPWQAPFPSVIMTFNCEIPSAFWDRGWIPCAQ